MSNSLRLFGLSACNLGVVEKIVYFKGSICSDEGLGGKVKSGFKKKLYVSITVVEKDDNQLDRYCLGCAPGMLPTCVQITGRL